MPVEPQQPLEATAGYRDSGWHHKLGRLLFVVFCFEVGVFLLVFPWLEPWDNNWFADALPKLSGVWDNPYFRGAVSGLGAVNLYISFAEVFRLRGRKLGA
jgi:hypothetical protein